MFRARFFIPLDFIFSFPRNQIFIIYIIFLLFLRFVCILLFGLLKKGGMHNNITGIKQARQLYNGLHHDGTSRNNLSAYAFSLSKAMFHFNIFDMILKSRVKSFSSHNLEYIIIIIIIAPTYNKYTITKQRYSTY